MSDPVLIALITGLCAVVGQWLISRSQNAKRREEEVAREVRLEDRLKSVEKKLDEHNQYAEKLGSLRDSMLLIQQDVKYIKEGKL